MEKANHLPLEKAKQALMRKANHLPLVENAHLEEIGLLSRENVNECRLLLTAKVKRKSGPVLSAARPGEESKQCQECHNWAHDDCTDGGDYFICPNCETDDDDE